MIGLLEQTLRDRYGEPTIVGSGSFWEYRWNDHLESRRSILYKLRDEREKPPIAYAGLHAVYGDAVGGSLLRGSLKVSMLEGPKVFGLYEIQELQANARVRHANSLDPAVVFFMDASNVWYYGLKAGELYAFDAEFEELDCLGDPSVEMAGLLARWEEAS